MRMFRTLTLLALTIAGACGGDSKDDANTFSGGRDKYGNCPQATGTCGDAEKAAYIECIDTQCGAEQKVCLGDGYRSGSFSGTCAAYAQCNAKCDCDDMTCMSTCGGPDTECVSCFQTVLSCRADRCPPPACLSEKPAGAAGTGGSAGTGGM